MNESNLEVFQDLHLRSQSAFSDIRERLLATVKTPWSHCVEHEQKMKGYAHDAEDVIVFIREPFGEIVEAALVLWQEPTGYRVTNIVPRKVGELGTTKYNIILQDFVEKVARPASVEGVFDVDLSSSRQGLNDWVDDPVSELLKSFSALANKSTGASHPRDQERWFKFLIAAYLAPARLDSDQLVRWLSEIEGWSIDTAHELARDYEFALQLLEKYDNS
jgi:hypothetical protein